jgi:adenylate cyclase
MATEIERKFLIKNDAWRSQVESASCISQGYLVADANVTVRVRLRGDQAFLTIKGVAKGISRSEFEYPVPVADAQVMLQGLTALAPVEKVRHLIRVGDHLWELDVFGGENAGLAMAEIELAAEDEPFVLPAWAGEEVTGDPRYYNAYLVHHPFTRW